MFDRYDFIGLDSGEVFTDQLDSENYYYHDLRGLATDEILSVDIEDVQAVDFQPTTSRTLDFTLATLTTSEGHELLVAPHSLELSSRQLWERFGLFDYPREVSMTALPLGIGVNVPFDRMAKFEVEAKGQLHQGITVTCDLMDGGTTENRLRVSDASLSGLTNLGPFSLDLDKVEKVDFHRHRADAPVPSMAIVTSRSGESAEVPTAWLLYYDEDSLKVGLYLENQGYIPFSKMESLEIRTDQSYITATIRLSTGDAVIDHLPSRYDAGNLQGPTDGGLLDIAIQEVKEVSFQPEPSQTVNLRMASVVTTEGDEFQTPADLLRTRTEHSSMFFGVDYRYSDELPLTTGQRIPLDRIGLLQSDGDGWTTVLVDGKTLDYDVDVSDDFSLCGLTELGLFRLNLSRVKEVDFHR